MRQTGLFEAGMEIPKRSLFKASEVCEIASVQPYVLRSWELEFPDMGVAKAAGGPRVYRRSDVERVLRIKQLVFAEGLTLAGVRRRIEDEAPAALDEVVEVPGDASARLGRSARARFTEVKVGLQSILSLLNARPGQPRSEPRVSAARVARPVRDKSPSRAAKPAGKPNVKAATKTTAAKASTKSAKKKPRKR